MTSSLIATTEVRFRPAVVATLITLTFLTGIGAGLGLARVTGGPVAQHAAVDTRSGSDMSAAAYSAAHQAAIDARPGGDMSSAAYSATRRVAIDVRSGGDMSSAAYDAMR